MAICSGAGTAAPRSSPRRSSGTASTTSAPGTGRSTRSTCARTSSAGASTPERRSPRAPRSPGTRSTSATTPDGCGRCVRAPGRRAGSARRTARSTGRPTSRTGASSSRPSATSSTRSAPAATSSGASARAATSTPRPRSGMAASSSARTTEPSTRSPPRAAGCSGASTRAARSRGRRRWSTASRTRARSRIESSASTPARDGSCCGSRTATSSRSRATRSGCSSSATRGSTRSSRAAGTGATTTAARDKSVLRQHQRGRRLQSRVVSASTPPPRGFDPEAEQEVDFAKYARLLAIRWWLLAAGLVIGAIIGYIVSIGGGAQVYSATATVYLGQPYSPSGGQAVLTPQNNPGAVAAIVNARSVQNTVANACHAKTSQFAKGISTQASSGGSSTKSTAPVSPLVKVTVQAKKGKLAACAANGLAAQVVSKVGSYPAQQVKSYESHVASDNADIKTIQTAIADPSVSTTDKLVLDEVLRSDLLDKSTYSGLLIEVRSVELPKVLTAAASEKITARSRRNTVLVAAVIGLIIGALAALLWDRGAALLRA